MEFVTCNYCDGSGKVLSRVGRRVIRRPCPKCDGNGFRTPLPDPRSVDNKKEIERLIEWAGGSDVTLAIVFTDLVGSVALGLALGNEGMSKVQDAHFERGGRLIKTYNGFMIKTIGDSLMAVFRNVAAALDFALAFMADPGYDQIQLRIGIHIGLLNVKENDDVSGKHVDFAARVVEAIEGAEIWLSEDAMKDIEDLRASRHRELRWKDHKDIEFKGFDGKYSLWSLVNSGQTSPE
jgi:class 3 adenylate cyclase